MDQAGALAHARQAESRLAPPGDLEPDAPVPHGQDQLPVRRNELDGRPRGLPVTHDVPEPFLRDAVDAEGHVPGKAGRDFVRGEADREAVALAEAETLRA